MNNINNSVNLNFKGVCIQKSLMNSAQIGRANKLADNIYYQKLYDSFVDKGIDFFIMPARSKGKLLIRTIDKNSGEYYKNTTDNKIAEINVPVNEGDSWELSTKILEYFNKVCTQKPVENLKRIFEGKTPLMKFLPESEEIISELVNDVEYYKTHPSFMFTDEEAKDFAFEAYKRSEVPKKGFDFDF